MDKETLSNYGWIVIAVLVLSVMIALATPFGTYIKTGVENAATGLVETSNKGINVALSATGVCDHRETEIRNITDTYTGDTYCTLCDTMISAGHIVRAKIPVGGKYTAADGTIYNSGDKFPEIVTTGDRYTYGDYEYAYNQYFSNSGTRHWETNETQNGWGVTVLDVGKTEYGVIIESINGEPVTCLERTFVNCTVLKTAPAIPKNVSNMDRAFWRCSNLTDTPAIPNGVTNMEGTFMGCSSLTTAPVIPDSVANITVIFDGCSSLETYVGSTGPNGDFSNYKLPDNITDMRQTFRDCSKLTKAPLIPYNVTNMQTTFYGCTSLVTAPVIPNSVTSMFATFQGCTSLTTVSIIPESVTEMHQTFYGCTGLTGLIEINANPTSCNSCLKSTQITGITGSCSQTTKDRLLATK